MMFQRGGLFNWKFWMYTKVPWFMNSLELFLMLPVAVVSGGLYFQAIWVLKKGKSNARKTTLTWAFFALWAAWRLCVFPYEMFDIYFMKNDRMGFGNYLVKPRQLIFSVINFGDRSEHNVSRTVFVESVLWTLKLSYSFVNSILLLILVRPFAEPLKSAVKWISCNKSL